MFRPFTLNINGAVRRFESPLVMGIVNATPDSFYAPSRVGVEREIADRVGLMAGDGVDIIDVGGYSSRPGAPDVDAGEELDRLRSVLPLIRKMAPDILISVDTFRSEVAKASVEEFGVNIINDISGGLLDGDMAKVVAGLKVPYVLMHMRGAPSTMQSQTVYGNVAADVVCELSVRLRELRLAGVADIIIDPGFGFAKTTAQNFELLRNLDVFRTAFSEPVLVGFSRKSMVTKPLGITASEALNGTTVLNTIALSKGASVLRVHDVREAVQAVKLFNLSI